MFWERRCIQRSGSNWKAQFPSQYSPAFFCAEDCPVLFHNGSEWLSQHCSKADRIALGLLHLTLFSPIDMGSKRNRLKKLSPIPFGSPPEPEDEGLVEDLLAQLDGAGERQQIETAKVLNEVENKDNIRAQNEIKKQDSKSRFKAREVCHTHVDSPFNL
jgi:hypothetical protein